MVLMQLDKVILSKLLNLEEFGKYTLSGIVASTLYILLTPLFNTIYPKMSALVKSGDIDTLSNIYRKGTRLLSVVIFTIAFVVAYFSQDFVYVWTGNFELALSIAPIISILIIGTAINGVMHFPYALQLAYGMTKIPLIITVVLILSFAPIIVYLVIKYGVIGGAIAWAVLNIIYLFFGTWLTHRYLLIGIGRKWLVLDVFFPFLLSLMTVSAGWSMLHTVGQYNLNLFWSVIMTPISMLIVLFILTGKSMFSFWKGFQNIGLVEK